MQAELHSLFNLLNCYKGSLINILDRIDDCLLEAMATSTPLSTTRKYVISNIVVNAVQRFLKMHYMGETLLEQLLLEVSEMDRGCRPERDRRSSNPFHPSPSNNVNTLHSTFKSEIGSEGNKSLEYCTAESDTETFIFSANESISSYCTVDKEVQTDGYKSVDAVVQADAQLGPCGKVQRVQGEGQDSDAYQSEQVLGTKSKETLLNLPQVPPRKDLKNNVEDRILGDVCVQKVPGEGQNQSKQVLETDIDTKPKETLLNLPQVPPRKDLIQNVENRAPVSFKITSKRKKLEASPICQSPKTVEQRKPNTSLCDWSGEASKSSDRENQKTGSAFKWVPTSQVTNNNKSQIKSNEKKIKEYDIMEEEVLVNDICTFSYIQSPSEFYVHIGDPTLCRGIENAINDDINSQSQYVVNKYKTKEEAKTSLGNFCFGFISTKSRWFRVEVLDWMYEDAERIFVQMIDHGEKTYYNYKNLKAMNDFYSKVPRLAVRCHLAALYSTDPNDPMNWSRECINCLTELAEMKKTKKFRILYRNKEGDSYAVDLLKEGGKNQGAIGEILVNKGLAFQVEVTQDDTLDKISEEDLECFENLNEAVAGYNARDEARLCRFTDETGTKCFKGPSCKLDHGRLSEDGYTTDRVATTKETIVDFVLPKPNDCVTILITESIDTCHFYAHILTNPSKLSPYYNVEYQKLREAMNANNIVQTYEKFNVSPALSELLLVKDDFEWHRGQCKTIEQDNFHIFLIDSGSTVIKKIKDLRQMKDDFLYVPQQAIECILHECREKPNIQDQSLEFYFNFMHMKTFTATVMDSGLPLQVRLWDEKGVDMDYVLKNYGIGQDRCHVRPATHSYIVCG